MDTNISVIMPVYNESNLDLLISITSILHQTLRPLELIIIDDNPKSNRIKHFLLGLNNNKIKVLYNKRNIGAGLSRNKGINKSIGKFIAFTDADDISNRNRLEKQYKFMAENKLDFVFSNSKDIDNEGNIIRKYAYKSKSIINQKKIRYILTHCSNIATQSSWLINRSILKKVRGYRSLIVEDYDFILRSLSNYYRLGYQSDVLITKRMRKNSVTQQNYLKQYLVAKIIRKHFNKYNNIMKITDIKKILSHYFYSTEIKRFKIFLKCGHKLKNNLKMSNIFYFIKSILMSRNALNYLWTSFIIYINECLMGIRVEPYSV